LSEAELRHFSVYFRLGETAAHEDAVDFGGRVTQLAGIEASLISMPDPQFRFHSGQPTADA
jgi:tRNA-(ms[2]io[6]A)-hydroxylase